MVAWDGGATLLLAGLLLAAGGLKLARPRRFAGALEQLLPRPLAGRHRLAVLVGRVVASGEIVLGLALLAAPRWVMPAAALAAAVFAAFLGAASIAIRGGTGCGCFGRVSERAADRADLARSAALAAIAIGRLVDTAWGRSESPWSTDALAAAAVFAAAMLAVHALARRQVERKAGRSAGAPAPLRGTSRAAVLDSVRTAPSYLALTVWLGDRAADLRLARSIVTGMAGAPGPIRWLVVTPPSRGGLRVTISLPWDGRPAGDVVISAMLDATPVLASGGVVRVLETASATAG